MTALVYLRCRQLLPSSLRTARSADAAESWGRSAPLIYQPWTSLHSDSVSCETCMSSPCDRLLRLSWWRLRGAHCGEGGSIAGTVGVLDNLVSSFVGLVELLLTLTLLHPKGLDVLSEQLQVFRVRGVVWADR